MNTGLWGFASLDRDRSSRGLMSASDRSRTTRSKLRLSALRSASTPEAEISVRNPPRERLSERPRPSSGSGLTIRIFPCAALELSIPDPFCGAVGSGSSAGDLSPGIHGCQSCNASCGDFQQEVFQGVDTDLDPP